MCGTVLEGLPKPKREFKTLSKSTECATCAWERGSGITVDTSKSKVQWASVVGVSEASIRRHLKHAPNISPEYVISQETARVIYEEKGRDLLKSLNIPESAVTSRGVSVRDLDTGSWEKITWNPNKKALADSLSYDDLKETLDGWTPGYQGGGPQESPMAHILNAADLQIGKASQRGGGTPETIARVRKSIETFASEYPGGPIVLVDNGDPIENVFNVSDQIVTNDLDVPAQIRTFRRLMLEAIKLLAPLTDDFTYVSVPSNHGAFRTGYKAAGGTTDADFGLEISYQLEDAVAENPYLTHAKFVRPDSVEETAVLEIANTKLAFNHGHRSGSVFSHGKWWQGQDHGRRPGWDADILVMAHFHTQTLYQSGDGRWVIGCASSDVGSDWFTNKTGESARSGMTAFSVLDGEWSNLRIV